ncbi:MAG: hypothetical protein GEU68_05510 [Actinobacteria bacterium]|nr:hypothetical protein [Actinomycetota bacterium]
MTLAEFLKGLLLRTPQEILVALLRALLLLPVFLLVLLLKLWEWLLWLLHTKTLRPEETEDPCGRIPEVLVRRPDPSIYSQTYLAAQGVPVTWNNPDIWIAPAANPGAVEPDSYHLEANTDYIVSVRAHNASTDPAIGVRVRLVYRPWSFNSPDVTPVEIDAGGNEVVRSVDIAAMGSAVAQFNWHTPALAPGESAHYCLQAHLSHPLDVNLGNNMGQENTNVYSQNPGFVSPGELAALDIPLFNVGRRAKTVRFRVDAYEVATDDRVEVRLERSRGRSRMRLSDRLGHALPTVEPVEVHRPRRSTDDAPERAVTETRRRSKALFGRVCFSSPKSRFEVVRTRYSGFDELRAQILDRDYSLPPTMTVAAPERVTLEPAAAATPAFEIQVPADARPGTRLPMNIRAETEDGVLIGGVTLFFHVRP